MVQMNIEVMFNVGEIGVDSYDFCVILGILLDNAIEAAKESDEKIVNVKFTAQMEEKLEKSKIKVLNRNWKLYGNI